MSAKKNSKSTPQRPAPAQRVPSTADEAPSPAAELAAPVAWIDSPEPRKRLVGKIAFVALWIYVAALCLLALDQTFHWGIFGPKVLPVP